jgi:hypothetical protein
MKISEMITELDTAVGMLIVAAMKDNTVKAAMEKVSKVSLELGESAEEKES